MPEMMQQRGELGQPILEEGSHHVQSRRESPPSLAALLQFASRWDCFCMGLAVVAGFVAGGSLPALSWFFTDLLAGIYALEEAERNRKTLRSIGIFLLVSVTLFISNFLMIWGLAISAARQTKEVRYRTFAHLMWQDVSWFDTQEQSTLTTRILNDGADFRAGIGEKLSYFAQLVTTIIMGFVVAFTRSWRLTLVMLAGLPVMGGCMGSVMSIISRWDAVQQRAYAQAGGVAETSLSAIRTVLAFGAQEREALRYEKQLIEAQKRGNRSGIMLGLGMGMGRLSFSAFTALGFWFGGKMVVQSLEDHSEKPFTGAEMLSCIFAIMMGGSAIGSSAPSIPIFTKGRQAAARLLDLLNDGHQTERGFGQVLLAVEGAIEFRDVTFTYPARPEVPALCGLSIYFHPGATTAVVGPSGAGKSTIVGLLQRFYAPDRGEILLDGENIRSLNISWLRLQMALVQQEPVLFSGTIYENIASGKDGSSQCDVEAAAKLANAHNFIVEFPNGYSTDVGERGGQMSGGQKQRLAIARAVIRDPKVLLLDEATSALDSESERVVQRALDSLLEVNRRTTIVIAHRLSTIQNADHIVVLQGGVLFEQGNHAELVAKPGSLYADLVNLQKVSGGALQQEVRVKDDKSPRGLSASSTKVDNTRNESSHILRREAVTDDPCTSSQEDDPDIPVPFSRLWSLNRADVNFLLIAMFGAALSGANMPLTGQLFATDTQTFTDPSNYQDTQKLSDAAVQLASLQLIVGAGTLVGTFCLQWGIRTMSESLSRQLRAMCFRAMLRQDMAWFDKRSTGILTTRLATEVPLINAFTGETFAQVLLIGFCVVVGVGEAFAHSWAMTLVVIGVFPFVALGNKLSWKRLQSNAGDSGTGELMQESLANIRTVAAYGLEEKVLQRYAAILDQDELADQKQAIGVAIGVAYNASMFGIFPSIVFGVGCIFINQGWVEPGQVTGVLFPLLFTALGLGSAFLFVKDKKAGQKAVTSVFGTIDRRSPIDPSSTDGHCLDQVLGKMELKEVVFYYPTRPDVKIFSGLNLTLDPCSTTALVGPSGSGKSSVVALLQRFYDPEDGVVLLDGMDIRSLNVSWLRMQMALVQQEPVLFTGSISDNIAYGKEGASQNEVETAAKMANAHGFITGFPQGYNTDVGERGGQMSGGQKQRLAIARSVIRNPKVLLLDEATSALDAESEQIVQRALDSLLEVRSCTTVVIAHRLSTIQNADKICVIHGGRVVEQGTHASLLCIPDGHYSKLVACMPT